MGRRKRRIRTFSIGIYIGRHDLDIAAWFNLLRTETSMSPAKWIHALLAADRMGIELDIGAVQGSVPPKAATPPPTINNLPQSGLTRPRSVNFGSGLTTPASQETKSKTNNRINPPGFRSGWMVKGPDGSYIYGSVISITISTPETIELINGVWKNNREFSSYLKALIRKYLKKESQARPPADAEYIRVRDAYLLYVANHQYDSRDMFLYKKPLEKPLKVAQVLKKNKQLQEEAAETLAPPRREPQSEQKAMPQSPSTPEPESASEGAERPAEAIQKNPTGKNPLLGYVRK